MPAFSICCFCYISVISILYQMAHTHFCLLMIPVCRAMTKMSAHCSHKLKKTHKLYLNGSWWLHQMETFYWPFVWGIHQSPLDSPHKGQWCGGLMFYLICAWTNSWANNWGAGDLRCNLAHYEVTVMLQVNKLSLNISKSHCMLFTRKNHSGVHDINIKVNNITIWRVISLRPRDVYMHHQTRPSLFQTMVWYLFGATPSSEPMLEYC